MIALAIIALIIFGICMISIGAEVEYIGEELKISAVMCGIRLQLFPRNKKTKENKPEEPKPEESKPEESKPAKPKRRLPIPKFNREELLELAGKALRGLGKFGKVTVNRFMLHVLVGGRDPYSTALGYGWLNAALSSLAPLCRSACVVRKSDVQTGVDFTAGDTEFDAALAVTIRLGQIFRVVFSILFGALEILLKSKRRIRREQKLAPQQENVSAENAEEIIINEDNSIPGERNEDNGNE